MNLASQGCLDKPATAPVFVPRTINGTLAGQIREVESEYNKYSKAKVKVVEEGGTTLVNILFKPDPWSGLECGRARCQVCKLGEGENCHAKSITYRNICLLCKENNVVSEYIGESSLNRFERANQHVRDGEKERATSHIRTHLKERHPDNPGARESFGMRIVRTHPTAFT